MAIEAAKGMRWKMNPPIKPMGVRQATAAKAPITAKARFARVMILSVVCNFKFGFT